MIHFFKLEQRIMLDAVGLAADFDFDDSDHDLAGGGSEFSELPDGYDRPISKDDSNESPRLLVIADNIQDRGDLAAAAAGGVSVMVYDFESADLKNLADRIEEELDGRPSASIALATHGWGPGKFEPAKGKTVSAGALSHDAEIRSFFEKMGALAGEKGRIDLLACGLAAGEEGALFMKAVSETAGAHVAASDDVTGNEAAGGDFEMETDGASAADIYFRMESLSAFDSLLGNGDFKDSGQNLGSAYSRGTALGDLDGDGDLDAFVANENQANRVWINNGSGTFTDSGQSLGTWHSHGVALGDLDGDGDLDAFSPNTAQGDRVWMNDGSGNFTDSGQSLGNYNGTDAALGDLDGDGDLDAFVTHHTGQGDRVWINDGSGTFTDSGQSLETLDSFGVELGDLDGDGDLDAFVANYWEQGNRVWLNNGSGTFTDSGQSLGSYYSFGVKLGDVDGDNDLDAFVANYGQGNRVWLNNGSGTFTDSGQSIGSSQSVGLDLGDVDVDGDLDVFVANDPGRPNKVWKNDGSGTFTDSGQSLGSYDSHDAALGDLDGDGDLDAFATNYTGQGNRVWINNDSPAITSANAFNSVEEQTVVATLSATDADGDAVVWSVSGGADQGKFSINASTGALTFLSAPDFDIPGDSDADNVYEVQVTASDGTLGAAQTISVTVTDTVETPVIVSLENLTVVENTVSVPFSATDPSGLSLTCVITGGADQARFVAEGAGFRFISPPTYRGLGDANADNVYEVSVSVTNGVFTVYQDIRISLGDDNSPPAITSPASASAPEGSLSAGTVTASDPDGGTLLYSVSGGADQALFSIGRLSGALTFKTAPDFENPADANSDNAHEVEVTVSDRKNAVSQLISVTVSNVDEAPVITGLSPATATENAVSGPTVSASDPEGGAVTYAVSGGADAGRFSIDPNSGALTFNAAPDYESPGDADGNNRHEVEITASDGSLSSRRAFSIAVTGVNEFSPVITSPAEARVYKDSAFVLNAAATDPDGDTLTWSVSGGADQGKFSIDPSSGALGFLSVPDVRNPEDADADNIYEVEITADDGTFFAARTVRAAVTDVAEPKPEPEPSPVIPPAPFRRPASVNATDTGGNQAAADQAIPPNSAPDFSTPFSPDHGGGERISGLARNLALDLIPEGGVTLGRIRQGGFSPADSPGPGKAPQNGNAALQSLEGRIQGFNVDIPGAEGGDLESWFF
ncbi:hypothetical protein EPICR_140020 [Candidatus Desulfarcum epimagneticum]|uniref:Cadherin domain-containing protein n=1 Tax=uncultured Desulfobacteraceae bacterium TaxID=218296 RepID=A0A484HFH8_9BACT|nr:hypothetical protein EPICR_140020 [uncultured Desulfobacteraceae bacterium]